MDFEDNPRNLLRAKEDVDVDFVFEGSFWKCGASDSAGSPVTMTFSIRGDVDVPTVVMSLALLMYRSSKGTSVALAALIRNWFNTGHFESISLVTNTLSSGSRYCSSLLKALNMSMV